MEISGSGNFLLPTSHVCVIMQKFLDLEISFFQHCRGRGLNGNLSGSRTWKQIKGASQYQPRLIKIHPWRSR